jgi:hypothetical protein
MGIESNTECAGLKIDALTVSGEIHEPIETERARERGEVETKTETERGR